MIIVTAVAALVLAGCTSGHTDSVTSSGSTPHTAASTTSGAAGSTSTGGGPRSQAAPGTGTVAASTPPTGTSHGDSATTERLVSEIPTAASLAAVRAKLPSAPIDATDALVAKIFGPDEKTAVAATAEILRRAGLPLVSSAEPILALPDTNMIVNQQIPIEMLPSLTDAVRSGQRYTLAQVAQLLALAGATDGTPTGPQLVAMLAQWGKTAGAPPESVVAGAAERALGRWHHQLLNPRSVVDPTAAEKARADLAHAPAATIAALTDPERVTSLDPLQVILLLAHATSYVDTVADVEASAPGLRRDSETILAADAPPASNALCSFLDFSDTATGKVAHGAEKNAFRQALIQGAKLALKITKTTAKILGSIFVGYDIATDVLITVLMFTGLKTQITFDKATTHFRHTHGDLSRDVQFTATVTFHSALQGDNGQYHGCWRFAGVKLPQNGGVKNWLVHWSVDGPVVVLQEDAKAPVPIDGGPAAIDRPTDGNGQSYTAMEPRTEKSPPPPGQDGSYPQHVMVNQVTAQPDPNLDLVKAGDIFNLGAILVNPLAPIILELEKIINRAVRNHLLPETTVPYPVSYHEKQPYTIRADGFLTVPLYAALRLNTDLYSCAGPAGPWRGTITFSVAAGGDITALAKLFGVSGADSGSFTKQISFTLDPHSSARQQIHIPTESGDMGLWLQLDQGAVEQAMHPSRSAPPPAVIGTGSWTFGGEDVTEIATLVGPGFANGLALPVEAAPLDPRCTGGTLADDTFDED